MLREVQYRTFVVNVGMSKTNILSCTIGQIYYEVLVLAIYHIGGTLALILFL